MQEPVRNPASFGWREVSKVRHYRLNVNALTKPMSVSDAPERYDV